DQVSRKAIFTALVPCILADSIPSGLDATPAIDDTIRGVELAIEALSPSTRSELGQLIRLLGFAPTRILLGGPLKPWKEATPLEFAAFLERWRTSRFDVQRSACEALRQIVLAAWYGNPRSWSRIGYAGPPSLVGMWNA